MQALRATITLITGIAGMYYTAATQADPIFGIRITADSFFVGLVVTILTAVMLGRIGRKPIPHVMW